VAYGGGGRRDAMGTPNRTESARCTQVVDYQLQHRGPNRRAP